MRKIIRITFFSLVLIGATFSLLYVSNVQKVVAQQPTGSVPTVTSTSMGSTIKVTYPEQINVRSGPSSWLYPAIGVMLPGEVAPALGRSPGGEWIVIRYVGVPGDVGWIYAPLVSLSASGDLPIVDPPPTPTPVTTPTIDPTQAAAFIPQFTPTRLPTFTPSGPLVIPTFEAGSAQTKGIPLGLVITLFTLIGGFGSVISFLQGR